MKKIITFYLYLILFSVHASNAIPFLHDEKIDNPLVRVSDLQEAIWRDDLSLLTYLCMDELGQMCFRSYPFSTIDTAGSYRLATNVLEQITISANDVTLDMNGVTISGGTNGIVVNSGLQNITIKNGMIDSVSNDGIQVNAGCQDITIKDVTITNALRGIDFEQVTNGLIKNCDLSLSTTGLELDACHNIIVHNCSARANTHAGYDVLTSTTCSFVACQALSTGNGNSDISSEVFGFVAKDGNGNIFERCIANATQALSITDFDAIVAGFALRGSESGTKIIDSESSNSETNVNGFTIPYGIWLEDTLDSTQTVTSRYPTTERVLSVEWSPDRQYIAVGRIDTVDNEFQILKFDGVGTSLSLFVQSNLTMDQAADFAWFPNGQYIALGAVNASGDDFQIFKFDANEGSLVSIAGAFPSSTFVTSVDWSFDGKYIAVGGQALDASGDELQIFEFDRANETITNIAGAVQGTVVEAARWSPDGLYIAVGGNGLSTNDLQIFKFDRAAGTLTLVTGALGTASGVRELNWSFDGQYLAVGTDNGCQVFTFDRSTETLTSIASALTGLIWTVSWSHNGKYIAIGGQGASGSNEFQILEFDRSAETLTSIIGELGTAGRVLTVDWSPDGEYIAVGGDGLTGGTGNDLQIFSGLQFPQNNVIKNNIVYGNSGAQFPSGVGIAAPSISNMIIGNTAYNNPFPRGADAPIVSSNYAFGTNIFNPLFVDVPSALQNISLSNMNPILNRFDIPLGMQRLEALAESLIDNLL